MNKKYLNNVFFACMLFGVTSPALAQSTYPAYFFLGTGILVVIALAIYVVKQAIRFIRNDCDHRSIK